MTEQEFDGWPPAPRRTGRADVSICISVHGAYHAMARRLTIATQEMGLSGSEAIVLAYLLSDSGCAPANIRHAVGLHRSTLSSMLDRLEHKKLIRRKRSAWDGRRLEIDLTHTGRTAAAIADGVIRDVEDELAVFTSAADRLGADQVFAACVAILWPGDQIDV